MFSIYSSAFNLIKNNFNYREIINNFCLFAEEVVIAINKSEDDSLLELKNLNIKNLKLIETDFDYNDQLLDGKIKNAALQNTSKEFKIGLDMDEYIPLWQKNIWEELAYKLRFDWCDCYMIPSVNLFKSKEYYSSVGLKWYLHKNGLSRGPVNFAKQINGTVDINKSDTCELIYPNGELVKSKGFPNDINILREGYTPFVIHTGYMSFQNRILRNKNFWKTHWLIESGGIAPNHKVHEKIEEFDEPFYKHLLKI